MALRRYRLLRLRGNAVECPCCGGRFSRFMPGLSHRDTRVCPRCGAQERHRALWLYMHERTDLFTRSSGSSTGRPSTRSSSRSEPAERLLRERRPRGPRGDAAHGHHRRPVPGRHLRPIVCIHVLEHVPDDRRAMREWRACSSRAAGDAARADRARAPDLEDPAIVTTRASASAAYWQEDHVRLYGGDFPRAPARGGLRGERGPWVRGLDPARSGPATACSRRRTCTSAASSARARGRARAEEPCRPLRCAAAPQAAA